jgi:hypothetical protein
MIACRDKSRGSVIFNLFGMCPQNFVRCAFGHTSTLSITSPYKFISKLRNPEARFRKNNSTVFFQRNQIRRFGLFQIGFKEESHVL